MYKSLLALSVVAIIASTSCKKKNSTEVVHITDTTYTIDTTVYPDTSYYIAGLFDQMSGTLSTLNVPISVSQNGITDSKVSLSVSGLPANSTADFDAKSGYPPYNTKLNIQLRLTPVGDYPITVTTTTEDNRSKNYSFNLKVNTVPKSNCEAMFSSIFTFDDVVIKDSATGVRKGSDPGFHYPGYGLYINKLFLYAATTDIGDYYISNDNPHTPNDNLDDLQINFDCTDGTINIPVQEIAAEYVKNSTKTLFYIYGKGKVDFTKNTYSITYHTSFNDNGTLRMANITLTGKINN